MQRITREIMDVIKPRLVSEATGTISVSSGDSKCDKDLHTRCRYLFRNGKNIVVVTGVGVKYIHRNNGIGLVATTIEELAEAIEEFALCGKVDFISINSDFLRNIVDRAASELCLPVS